MPFVTTRTRFGKLSQLLTTGFAWLALMPSMGAAAQQSFKSTQAGADALVKALEGNDQTALRAIFGSEGSRLLSSGDPVADANYRAAFVKAYGEAHRVVPEGDTQARLVVGSDGWPMPIPMVKAVHGWRFDTIEGADEIIKRRIGRDELEAIQVCQAIVDAQRDYSASMLDKDGVPVYATRIISRPGQRDGLYWPAATGEAPSPLGALLAAAADEGYPSQGALRRTPYRGYYFRILKSQGADAPDGALDYMVGGKMIGGFAVIAYPARYGASGVMSFLVNHGGATYQSDLGPATTDAAVALKSFNPGPGWTKLDPVPAVVSLDP
jgi:hypothetical protein